MSNLTTFIGRARDLTKKTVTVAEVFYIIHCHALTIIYN
jgi:hypothetical protein